MQLDATPGLLFVLASFFPLLGFLFLVFASLVRAALKPFAEKNESVENVYKLLGGDQPSFGAGIVASLFCGLALMIGLLAYGVYFDRSLLHQGEDAKATDRIAAISGRLATAKASRLPELRKEVTEARTQRDTARLAFARQFNGEAAWLTVLPATTPTGQATTLPLGFQVDSVSGLLFLVIILIALMVHIFSMSFLTEETDQIEDQQVPMEFGGFWRRGRLARYYAYLSLLTFGMLQVVLSNNLFQFFLAWQLVGVAAYFLVGFWYERPAVAGIALRFFVVQRVGDVAFLAGMAILWSAVGTVNFTSLESRLRAPLEDRQGLVTPGSQFVYAGLDEEGKLRACEADGADRVMLLADRTKAKPGTLAEPVPRVGVELADRPGASVSTWLLALAGMLFVIAAAARLAQVPVQTWLPESLAGPLPAVLLIQTVTLSAAAILLLIRSYPILTPGVLIVVAYLGLIGLVLGGLLALFQVDLLRILTFSTMSQNGLILIGLGVGAWSGALFHLMTHALCKGVLILGAGCVIYSTRGTSDLRLLGGLALRMTLAATATLLATLALAGMPFLSGWYSKEAILEQVSAFAWLRPWHALLFLGPLLISGVTAFYLFRMWILTFQGLPREPKAFLQADEGPTPLTFPLLVLSFMSIVFAWGLTPWDPNGSWIENNLHMAQPLSVQTDYGTVAQRGEIWAGAAIKDPAQSERLVAYQAGFWAMLVTLFAAVAGVVLAYRKYAPRGFPTEDEYLAALGVPVSAPTPSQRPSILPGPRLWEEDEPDPVPVPQTVAPDETPGEPEPTGPKPPVAEPGPRAAFLASGFGLEAVYQTLFVWPITWLGQRSGSVEAIAVRVVAGLGTGLVTLARLVARFDREIVLPGFAGLGRVLRAVLRPLVGWTARSYLWCSLMAGVAIGVVGSVLICWILPG